MKVVRYNLIAIVLFLGIASLFPRGLVHAGDASKTSTSDTGVANGQTTHDQESRATETNQQGLLKATPLPPPLTDSQERKNLIERLKRVNNATRIGYVALLGPQGQLVAYYTVKGKISSLNSYLTTTQQVKCQTGSYQSQYGCVTVDSPDLDGSYGNNPSGVFFFTTAGVMIEWTGEYLYSDQPLTYSQSPILIQKQ